MQAADTIDIPLLELLFAPSTREQQQQQQEQEQEKWLQCERAAATIKQQNPLNAKNSVRLDLENKIC